MEKFQKISVIGAGTMGAGIAQAAALAGCDVILYDLNDDVLERTLAGMGQLIDKGVARGKTDPETAARAKAAITLTTELPVAAAADLVIEAAPEDVDLKREIFRVLDNHAPPGAILASNTSSLSISAVAAATARPGQVAGLHFFNPAHIMKLVEIVRGLETSDETIARCQAFVAQLGKTAVLCQDSPGFVVNRIARPFYGEAFRLLDEQTADVPTIDRLMRSLGFRMGPFELIDLVGCDVSLAVTKSVYDAFFHDPKYRPHPRQQRMVDSGRLGRKTGRGFYNYEL